MTRGIKEYLRGKEVDIWIAASAQGCILPRELRKVYRHFIGSMTRALV